MPVTFLVAFLVVARASDSFEVSMELTAVRSSVTAPTLSLTNDSEVLLTPIDTASSASTTFQLVDNVPCNATVSDKLYVIYDKNRALFDLCVLDAQYQIFPFLGTEPSAAQIKDMASSLPCVAVFTGLLLANFPQCSISGFSLKAAVETLLKIHVDLVYDLAASPTAERFQELLSWRRLVNLAIDAGRPCDSDSELYAEYEENLHIAQRNSSIRMVSNYQIEYKLASGSWYDADGEDYSVVGNGGHTVGTVSAGRADSKVSNSQARNVEKNVTIADNSAMAFHGVRHVIPVLVVCLVSGAFFMAY